MTTVTVSLAQFQVSLGSPEKNITTGSELIRQAAKVGSQLVLLPELWTSGFDLNNRDGYAQFNQEYLPEVARLSIFHDIYIGGSYILEHEGRYYNQFVLTTPDGSHFSYSKIHLFRLMQEEQYFHSGDGPVDVDTPMAHLGLSVCYDLRFPELFRALALRGAQLICLVGEWPKRRIEHWQILLRARAIENQVFMAAVNTTGDIDGVEFGGSSCIISPWGEILVDANQSEGIFTAHLSIDEVARARKAIPILEDRQPTAYGSTGGTF